MNIHAEINNILLHFHTEETLFSPRNIDRGTLAMLSAVDLSGDDKVLDLGCGYGVVGIYAAKVIGPDRVVITDLDEMAVKLARENTALNGVEGIRVVQGDAYAGVQDNDFSLILVNPPYHTDFSVPKRFIEKGFNRLRIGGRIYLVTKRKEWYKNKLVSIFGGVKIFEVDGYYVFMSVKKSGSYASAKKRGE